MSPGRSQGVSQAPSRVKFDPKRYRNGCQNGGQNRLDWARQMRFCSFESRIKILASQCVYLYEISTENPCRQLPGGDPPAKKLKNDWIWEAQGGREKIPPQPGSGIAIKGIYVGEWMVPRCYRIDYSEKGLLITKKNVSFNACLRCLRRQEASPSSRTLIFFM